MVEIGVDAARADFTGPGSRFADGSSSRADERGAPPRSVKLACSVVEEHGRYVLTCLVFPECRGEGATLEEARASVAEAIRRHVADLGREYVPPPGAEMRYVEI